MMYDYQGVVDEVGQTQSFGANGFTKREIIIDNDVESDNRYPNPVKFTFKRGNCALLDGIRRGQRVKVRFAIDGRRWDGGSRGTQYFVDLTGLKIEVLNSDGTSVEPVAEPSSAATPYTQGAVIPPPPPPAQALSADIDDVPF